MAGYVPGGSSAAVGTAIKNAAAAKPPAPKRKPPGPDTRGAPVDPFAPWTPQQIAAQAQAAAGRYRDAADARADSSQRAGDARPGDRGHHGEHQRAERSRPRSSCRVTLRRWRSNSPVSTTAPPMRGLRVSRLLEAALQQSLSGGGQQLAQGLRDRLGAIGGGSVQSAASGLADRRGGDRHERAGGSGERRPDKPDRERGGRTLLRRPASRYRAGAGAAGIAGVEAARREEHRRPGTAQYVGQLPPIVENLRAQGLTLQQARAAAYQHVQGMCWAAGTCGRRPSRRGLASAQGKAAIRNATLSHPTGTQ